MDLGTIELAQYLDNHAKQLNKSPILPKLLKTMSNSTKTDKKEDIFFNNSIEQKINPNFIRSSSITNDSSNINIYDNDMMDISNEEIEKQSQSLQNNMTMTHFSIEDNPTSKELHNQPKKEKVILTSKVSPLLDDNPTVVLNMNPETTNFSPSIRSDKSVTKSKTSLSIPESKKIPSKKHLASTDIDNTQSSLRLSDSSPSASYGFSEETESPYNLTLTENSSVFSTPGIENLTTFSESDMNMDLSEESISPISRQFIKEIGNMVEKTKYKRQIKSNFFSIDQRNEKPPFIHKQNLNNNINTLKMFKKGVDCETQHYLNVQSKRDFGIQSFPTKRDNSTEIEKKTKNMSTQFGQSTSFNPHSFDECLQKDLDIPDTFISPNNAIEIFIENDETIIRILDKSKKIFIENDMGTKKRFVLEASNDNLMENTMDKEYISKDLNFHVNPNLEYHKMNLFDNLKDINSMLNDIS
eukprot:TRINITY_DN11949_c0_g1_i1.p1 TRINITY_DN11949_c0_g1~~TRINITY_DN11949_c0_g1_i1.p1  ORF type:complete len:469 (+),score=136.39 TRINITY_DN11949_c0_g1_i1:41-1447(+)